MDYKIFRIINQLAGRYSVLDMLMILISNKVRYLFVFVLMLMWFRGYSQRKVTVYAVISSTFTWLINMLIQCFYFKPRPFMKRRAGILIPSKMNSSFLSIHTLLTTAVSTSIFLRERILGSVMWILSLLTGFSRILVGHHYPSDIIRSLFIGSLTSIIVEKVFGSLKIMNRKSKKYYAQIRK
ncbi:phosphatase PAP2 family protein [Priestia megaterium]|nr:phosphatase PAP2 family protein [Priestia megaterium]MCF6799466.1 phosphatase PAP2 family protein [Bacillus sp. ET1]MBD8847754.1 phosphatase PAP2 family protein [Priestia megaterium]MDN4866140.1 phosphatase PAP2 family protein [Priestia megaterium]MED3816126.1 phosphatase PAP2 family protein [Priestia megaterium]MED4184768.1 phosphatase PAP2 family protein [Priestia megaterium]